MDGVWRVHLQATGATHRGSPFTREQLLAGVIVRGGDDPVLPDAPGDRLFVEVDEGGGDLREAELACRSQHVVSGQHLAAAAVGYDRPILAVVAQEGVEPGNMADLLRAMRRGETYANVHTPGRAPGGEIRGQIFDSDEDDDRDH